MRDFGFFNWRVVIFILFLFLYVFLGFECVIYFSEESLIWLIRDGFWEN